VARLENAQIDLGPCQDEPEHLRAAPAHAAEVKAHHHTPVRQPIERDTPAHVPHEQPRVEVRALHRLGPALAPFAQAHHDLAKLLTRCCEPVSTVRTTAHPTFDQLPQALGEQRARHARHAAVDVVELAAAEHELA
jgi:hypothetical protein